MGTQDSQQSPHWLADLLRILILQRSATFKMHTLQTANKNSLVQNTDKMECSNALVENNFPFCFCYGQSRLCQTALLRFNHANDHFAMGVPAFLQPKGCPNALRGEWKGTSLIHDGLQFSFRRKLHGSRHDDSFFRS